MSAVYSNFQAEVISTMATAWSLTTGNGGTLFTAMQGQEKNLLDTIIAGLKGGSGLPAPPYGILRMGRAVRDQEFGIPNTLYRAPVWFYWVDIRRVGGGTIDQQQIISEQLETLQSALETPGTQFNTFQIIDKGTIDTSVDENTQDDILTRLTSFNVGVLAYDTGLLYGTINWP
jgi:hypothetical protein